MVVRCSTHFILCNPEAPGKQKQTRYMPKSRSLAIGLATGHVQGSFQSKMATNFTNINHTPNISKPLFSISLGNKDKGIRGLQWLLASILRGRNNWFSNNTAVKLSASKCQRDSDEKLDFS